LIIGIKELLLRFGIHSSIQKTQKADYRPQYILNLYGKENLLKFIENIGIFGEKTDKLNLLSAEIKDTVANTNVDIIDKSVWQKIKVLKQEKGLTERNFQAALNTQYCGSSLYKSNLSRERLTKVAEVLENEDLSNLANSDIRWEKIKRIEHVSDEMTYDIYVEHDHHNFVAENFIVHNSGAIEQDADMVTFIYRPEYYGILEDENGASLKGVAEFIIAKHRHGALETVKLKFTADYAKFSNLDDPNFSGFNADAFVSDPYAASQSMRFSSKMNNDDIPF
jgi:replicative DNA helicase